MRNFAHPTSMSIAVLFPRFRLLLALLVAGALSGCVTNPYTGQKEFTPWTALKKADNSFGDMLDKANTSPDPRKPDWWNPDQ